MGQNCSASASVGALFCLKCCNADLLRGTLAYAPPEAASYEIEEVDYDSGSSRMVYSLERLRNTEGYKMALDACLVYQVETRQDEKIPIVWVAAHYAVSPASSSPSEASEPPTNGSSESSKLPQSGKSPVEEDLLYVLIHCHGNATDIGMMMSTYWELAFGVGVVVVGVEYSGYGAATGKARLRNTYADVEAAYNLALDWGVPTNRIIVYGQSIGSGPAMWLACHFPIAGIIFHSPFLSGIRVIDPEPEKCCSPSSVFSCFDFYKNIHRIKEVTCPVLIIHGKEDRVVPFKHGQDLYENCRDESKWEPYFPEGAGHHDVVEHNPAEYYSRVEEFISELERRRLTRAFATGEACPPEVASSDSGPLNAKKQKEKSRTVENQSATLVPPKQEVMHEESASKPKQAASKPKQQVMTLYGKPHQEDTHAKTLLSL